MLGIFGSITAIRRARIHFARMRYVSAILCAAVSVGLIWAMLSVTQEEVALADTPVSNVPIGVAKGINPGRVVWAHNPEATSWQGPGNGHWWEDVNTNQALVDEMMSKSIQELASQSTDAGAWDAIFRYYNQTHGNGDVGYSSGEKITIKVNSVGTHYLVGAVDTDTYELDPESGWIDYHHVGPQAMLAVLRQLINVVGVAQTDISIGDTLSYFSKNFWQPLHDEFPNVNYLDYAAGNAENPRTGVSQSTSAPVYWSNHPGSFTQDYAPTSFYEADYIINMANLKDHGGAGITGCAKNHYGSLIRTPGNYEGGGYYDLHLDMAESTPGMGHYRTLVDLMGHQHIGGKTLLYLIDGLYGGDYSGGPLWPLKFQMAPFNNDWTSSFFVSLDPVAIDSVAFDVLWAEPQLDDGSGGPHMSGAEDFLHEAALADNPPSGTFYDPDHSGDVTRLPSLGTHEHWNNPIDRQYSRNLGTGDGIELVMLSLSDAYKYHNADYAAITVDGNPIDWASLNSEAVEMDLAKLQADNGDMACQYRLAWDKDYLYILAEELSGDTEATEAGCLSGCATEMDDGTGGESIYDNLGLLFDFNNDGITNNVGDPIDTTRIDLWLFLGFSSTGRTDLMMTWGNGTWGPGHIPGFIANGSVATSGTLGGRVIEARLKWQDIINTLEPSRHPFGGFENAIHAGFTFGCEPRLADQEGVLITESAPATAARGMNGLHGLGPWEFPTGNCEDSREGQLIFSGTCSELLTEGIGYPGDYDGDCDVDWDDMTGLIESWLQCNEPGNPNCWK
jgi:hypothetical protein